MKNYGLRYLENVYKKGLCLTFDKKNCSHVNGPLALLFYYLNPANISLTSENTLNPAGTEICSGNSRVEPRDQPITRHSSRPGNEVCLNSSSLMLTWPAAHKNIHSKVMPNSRNV